MRERERVQQRKDGGGRGGGGRRKGLETLSIQAFNALIKLILWLTFYSLHGKGPVRLLEHVRLDLNVFYHIERWSAIGGMWTKIGPSPVIPGLLVMLFC